MKVNDRYCSFYYEDDLERGEVEIDPAATALLVVDMQHVFVTRPQPQDPNPTTGRSTRRWSPTTAGCSTPSGPRTCR